MRGHGRGALVETPNRDWVLISLMCLCWVLTEEEWWSGGILLGRNKRRYGDTGGKSLSAGHCGEGPCSGGGCMQKRKRNLARFIS